MVIICHRLDLTEIVIYIGDSEKNRTNLRKFANRNFTMLLSHSCYMCYHDFPILIYRKIYHFTRKSGLWPVWTYYQHSIMTSLDVSPTHYYDQSGLITNTLLWPVWTYNQHTIMTSLDLLPTLYYDQSGLITNTLLWPVWTYHQHTIMTSLDL